MGEGERCPRERPGPGPEAARLVSVAIGDVAAESLNVGVRAEPGLATGGGAEVVAGVACPLAVALVVVIVAGGGSRMRWGKKSWAGKGPVVELLILCSRCTLSDTVSRA